MGHAWAIHPRLLCSAGEPIETPRLHPCVRLEGTRSKEAGSWGGGVLEAWRRQDANGGGAAPGRRPTWIADGFPLARVGSLGTQCCRAQSCVRDHQEKVVQGFPRAELFTTAPAPRLALDLPTCIGVSGFVPASRLEKSGQALGTMNGNVQLQWKGEHAQLGEDMGSLRFTAPGGRTDPARDSGRHISLLPLPRRP
ncbi:unnamed protein product [Prorocentrum cordatum]|uniref:Uncharacterized protein n=1 Tax=Prorocentrum cordatum TaxID=2364126 RepID=A0ABN9USV2_9DINO|nr:unnamed protein product [Polarella glacialis]